MTGLDPRARILLAGLFAAVTVTLNQPPALALALLCALAMAVLARLAIGSTVKRVVALDGFMVAMVALLPFTMPGEALGSIAGWPASREGLIEAARILARANAVMLALLALLGTLGPVRLGHGLARLGLPRGFVQLFLFTVRYISVIEEEAARLRLAMRARGFRLTASRHAWNSMGQLFGMLLVRSLERAERIHAAMRCRGFTGRFPSMIEARWGRGDTAGLMLGGLAAAGLLLLEHR